MAEKKVSLVLAPHADDETLGMGGTIARLVDEGEHVVVAVLTGHGGGDNPIGGPELWEEIRGEAQRAIAMLGASDLIYRELPAVHLDHLPARDINKVVAEVIAEADPQDIYIPFAYDLHKDHGAIAYAVNVATRPYLSGAASIERVLAYETLSETHLSPPGLAPAFQPNHFVNVTATLERKIAAMQCYESQIQSANQPRSVEGLRALARLRGTHIGVDAAEAFMILGDYRR